MMIRRPTKRTAAIGGAIAAVSGLVAGLLLQPDYETRLKFSVPRLAAYTPGRPMLASASGPHDGVSVVLAAAAPAEAAPVPRKARPRPAPAAAPPVADDPDADQADAPDTDDPAGVDADQPAPPPPYEQAAWRRPPPLPDLPPVRDDEE